MPDSADGAFNEIEDVADKVDDAQDRWDKMKPDEKVFYFQTEFGDEPIVDFLENDGSIMESIISSIVAKQQQGNH